MRDLIRGLARPMLRLLSQDERGVVGVLVGLLLGTVLLGLGALVIDVGQLYAQRAQLQSGADAAANAVAKSCVLSTCTNSSAVSTAVTYADDNANGSAGVPSVCGSGSLGACSASTGAMTDCPAAPAAGTKYVDVHTATKTAAGGTVVAPVFARELLGNASYTGTQVLACAQAEWGPPASAVITGFAISACTWDAATSQGTVYGQPPPYPPNTIPASSVDQQLTGSTGVGSGCSTEATGSASSGQFGWTNDTTGSCSTTISGSTFGGNPGASASAICKTVLASDQANKTLIYLPVYTTYTGTGSNTVYTLKGFAAFVVTGYKFPGANAPDWLNSANTCTGASQCISGYFTQAIIPYTGSMSGTYLGAAVIRITG